MAVTMLALPGSSYLYQGEELGLPEVLDLPAAARQDPVFRRTAGRVLGRDGCRVPLPWTDHAQASHGFSAVRDNAGAGPAWLPQPTGWGAYAVASEDADPSSMLTLYRSALRVRSACLSGMGDRIVWIDDLGDDVVAFDRGTVRVVLNLSADRLALPEQLVRGRRIVLSSEQDHDDPRLIPVDVAVWLA
jgi:alpha-glucosidase